MCSREVSSAINTWMKWTADGIARRRPNAEVLSLRVRNSRVSARFLPYWHEKTSINTDLFYFAGVLFTQFDGIALDSIARCCDCETACTCTFTVTFTVTW